MKKNSFTYSKLLIAFFLLLCGGEMVSQSIFTDRSYLKIGDLNANQKIIYTKIQNQGIYSSINFVLTEDITRQAVDGNLLVSLPQLPCGRTFQMTHVDFKDADNFEWIGKYFTDEDSTCTHGDFTLIKTEGNLIGHLILEKRSYELFDLTGGLQVLCETNLNIFSERECGTIASRETSVTTPYSSPCADNKSKVLFLYTPSALATEANITGRANLCISQINQIWANSGIYNTLTIAAIKPLTFTESGSISNDINSLAANNTAQSLRAQYNAEIVILLTSGNYTGVYGVAKNIGVGFADSYAIVDVTSSTTGRYTFAHEVSHLFGARHDNDPSQSNEHGHSFKTGAGWFGWGGIWRKTLMVVIPAGEVRIEHVSNPSVNFMNVPTGVPFHNNAYQVNNLQSQIGSFYPDAVPSFSTFTVYKQGCTKYWNAQVTICGSGSYTFNWFISNNGFYWNSVGSGSGNMFYVPNNNMLMKCEVRNASNVLVNVIQRNLITNGCMGHAYRTGSYIEDKMDNFSSEKTLNLYPNPNNGSFTLEVKSNEDDKAAITIYDINGKLVEEVYNGIVVNGLQNIKINCNSVLTSGVYIVKVVGSKVNSTNRIIINK